MSNSKLLQKLFKVDSPSDHAFISDGMVILEWVPEGKPDFEAHIKGEKRLCITPIGTENTCYFGALDFDAKGDDVAPINHTLIQMFINDHNLPLNLFYSRSGKGAHAYLFSRTPISGKDMRATMRVYSLMFKQFLTAGQDIEIFPKQDELDSERGSCIYIPYFGDSCQPLFEGEPRYAMVPALPPCIQNLPRQGERNNYTYHVSNFLYLIEAKNVKNLVLAINRAFEDPQRDSDVEKTVASARRQQRRDNSGYGLGCRACPTTRKEKCKFSIQLVAGEVRESIKVTILHYISVDEKIQLTIDGKSIIFTPDEAFNHHKVSTTFILKHGITSIPEMKPKDWSTLLKELLKEAIHVDAVHHADKGHYIIEQLRKWSSKFKPGVHELYSGTPVFISSEEAMVIPHDVYQYLSTKGVMGISPDDVIKTLESIGTPVKVEGLPVIKIPVEILRLEGKVVVSPVTVNNIDPEEIRFIPGEKVKMLNAMGVEIRLTDQYLTEHPEVRRKIVDYTTPVDSDPGF